MRIALIKMSSMGDVIHALPVVTDLLQADPEATIDWIVEEPFADLVRLHPGVNTIVPVSLRRWRRQWRQVAAREQFRVVRAELKNLQYDLVIDLQGLLKSAWVARWVNGPRAGYHRTCAREPLASLSYQRRYRVDMQAHAIEKMRSLAAQAVGYAVDGPPVFGLDPPTPDSAVGRLLDARPRYWVFLHATSRAEKLWPFAESVAFLQAAKSLEMPVFLPWGSPDEQAAARALVEQSGHGTVLDRLNLAGCAAVLARAQGIVGVDTGLTHLAAALDKPTVALFAATEARRYGPYWTSRAASLGCIGQWPRSNEVISKLDELMAIA